MHLSDLSSPQKKHITPQLTFQICCPVANQGLALEAQFLKMWVTQELTHTMVNVTTKLWLKEYFSGWLEPWKAWQVGDCLIGRELKGISQEHACPRGQEVQSPLKIHNEWVKIFTGDPHRADFTFSTTYLEQRGEAWGNFDWTQKIHVSSSYYAWKPRMWIPTALTPVWV